ncbi:MAG: FtsH protease activity modulator HflK [Natronospirillum sp.]
MAWNEPPDNRNKDQDPWGKRPNGGGKQDGPPDLDQVIGDLTKKINSWLGGGKRGGSGGGSSGKGSGGPKNVKGIVLAALILVVGVGLYNSFYTLDEQQRGVVLRFGTFHKIEMPGLRFKLPLVDQVEQVNVTNLRSYSYQDLMLTEDENIVDISMTVQYLATDARAFALNVRAPEQSMEDAADAALRHEMGGVIMDEVLTVGRAQLAANVRARLQQYVDNYGSGIEVSAVNIREARAPSEVQDAYDDVIRAREDEQRVINQAQSYANEVVPLARGQAQRQLEEAEAYRAELVATAEGDAARFTSLLTEYSAAPEVTRERLYLETISSIYGDVNKVLLDVSEGSNNLMYLPLDRLSGGGSGSGNMSNADLDRLSQRLDERRRLGN